MLPETNNHTYSFKECSGAQFEELLNSHMEAVILDVRSPTEFQSEHIPGAINLNVMDPSFRQKLKGLNPHNTYAVYCRSGFRSSQACLVMTILDFTSVYNLTGGLLSWDGPVVSI